MKYAQLGMYYKPYYDHDDYPIECRVYLSMDTDISPDIPVFKRCKSSELIVEEKDDSFSDSLRTLLSMNEDEFDALMYYYANLLTLPPYPTFYTAPYSYSSLPLHTLTSFVFTVTP